MKTEQTLTSRIPALPTSNTLTPFAGTEAEQQEIEVSRSHKKHRVPERNRSQLQTFEEMQEGKSSASGESNAFMQY